jgi:molybdopterin-guanine dinucleotide biosynthesis protein A/nucleoside-triphosphatase THEP1
MRISNIYVLSQPIQTGKTTLLMDWLKTHPNTEGFLTPDIKGKRKLFDIASQTYHDLQLDDKQDGIKIGRFVFDETIFAQARQILTDAFHNKPDWIVVDEIGRLEMERNEGLEPAVSNLINQFRSTETDTKLLLVIRDYLLQDAKKHYGITDANTVDLDFFKPNQPITGLILCGGQSVRMGTDKAFIIYNNKAQYAYVADMLKAFCSPIFISCNSKQQPAFLQQYKSIIDNATFGNIGPMAGVLTAFEKYPQSAILVIGCDYPYLQKDDIEALCVARDAEFDAVCYQNNETGFDEPLLAIYEKQCALLMLQYFQNGHHSMRYFLQTIRTKRMYPKENNRIQSVDC